jgi:hypothetical protein
MVQERKNIKRSHPTFQGKKVEIFLKNARQALPANAPSTAMDYNFETLFLTSILPGITMI